jgi:hypothetical protein
MALSCAIFFVPAGELEPTVAPITIVDDCSHLTLVEINKIANNTGIISSIRKFVTNSVLNLNTVTSNSDNFYLIECLL